MKKIAVICINYNRFDLTRNLIHQFANINSPNFFYHLIIIDNNSADKSYLRLKKLYNNHPLITLIKSETNTGFSGGVNIGLTHALAKRYDFALLINNDTNITRNFLNQLIKPFFTDPHLLIAGPKIYFSKGHEYHHHYTSKQLGKILWSVGGLIDWQNIYGQNRGINQEDKGQYNHYTTSLDFISGCCMLIRLKNLNQVGLFDDQYFMYMEDCDFCTRAKRSGFHIAYVPKSIIYHHNAGSSQAGGDMQQYFLSRNRLLFASKYANLRTKFALVRQSLTIILGKYKWQKRGVIDYYLKKLGPGSWPIK